MHASFTLSALAALASTVAAGTLYVDNHCSYTVYLQSSSSPQTNNPLVTLQPNTINAYNEVMRNAGYTSNALTISRTPNLANPLQATYTETTQGPSPGLNYYALSTIYGSPFQHDGFELLAQSDGFSINCPPSNSDCPNTYSPSNQNGNNAVFAQNDLEDLVLTLCKSS